MAYSMEEFLRETHELVLAEMTVEERLSGIDPDEVLKRYRPEEVLKRFRPEERLRGLGPEERLKGIDLDVVESWLAKAKRGEGARE